VLHFPLIWRLNCRYLDLLPSAIFNSQASSLLPRITIFTFLIFHSRIHSSLPRAVIFRLWFCYAWISNEQKFGLIVELLFLITHLFGVESNFEAVHFDSGKIVLFLVPVYVLRQLQLNVSHKEILICDSNLQRNLLYLDLEWQISSVSYWMLHFGHEYHRYWAWILLEFHGAIL